MASTDRRAGRVPSTPALPSANDVAGSDTMDVVSSGYRHSSASKSSFHSPARQSWHTSNKPGERSREMAFLGMSGTSAWSRCQGLGVRHQGRQQFCPNTVTSCCSARYRYRSVQHVSFPIPPRDRCGSQRCRSLPNCGTRRPGPGRGTRWEGPSTRAKISRPHAKCWQSPFLPRVLWHCGLASAPSPKGNLLSSRVWFFKERLPAMKVARLENLTRAYECMGKGWSATKHA
jgi:hypothetical protein